MSVPKPNPPFEHPPRPDIIGYHSGGKHYPARIYDLRALKPGGVGLGGGGGKGGEGRPKRRDGRKKNNRYGFYGSFFSRKP